MFPAISRTLLLWGMWGRRRFTIVYFSRAKKSGFSLGQFGQRTSLGVHRSLVLSLLAHWVRVEREDEGLTWWEVARWTARVLLPDMVPAILLWEFQELLEC